jgi:hypothetical protein
MNTSSIFFCKSKTLSKAYNIKIKKSEPLAYTKITHTNPLNAKLNSICYLLALLGAHHILHVSGVGVKAPYSTSIYKQN